MDARPLLERVALALSAARLEAVLVGNAGAALQGAPVTTLDFDFMFLKTPMNLRKLKKVAKQLDAVVLKPFYPASDMFRLVNDQIGLQVDLMPGLDGIRPFEALRARAAPARLGRATLLVADLRDIVRSKRAANRPRHSRCWRRRSVRKRKKGRPSTRQLVALQAQSERALREQIRRLLAKPMHERTHFLRVRLPGGGSAL